MLPQYFPLFPESASTISTRVDALYFFILFLKSKGPEGNKAFLWYAIGLAVVACICALLYFVRHVNKEEEIHITQ